MTDSRWSAQRLLWASSPCAAVALYICALVAALAPNILIVSVGRLIGRVSQATGSGAVPFGAQPTGMLLGAIGVSLVLLLVIEPLQDALGTVVSARLTYAMQSRLMKALSAPIGTGHLETPENLNSIALVQGILTTFRPADAPAKQIQLIGVRLSGLLACLVVGEFRWWLGVVLIAMWLAARRPLRNVIVAHVKAFGGDAGVMRRAAYFYRLATEPIAAKELRLFGLGGWVVDRYREHWLVAMATVWSIRMRLFRAVALVGAGVVLGNLFTCGVLAYAVIHRNIDLAGLATVFPGVVGASALGGVTFGDIALEWMLAGLPHLDRLEVDLASAAKEMQGKIPVSEVPREEVRFRSVTFTYSGSDHEVFHNLDLTIPAGRSTAIVGVNGAGKSTLIKLLTRMHDPTGGEITVDGESLTALRPQQWQRNCALISQDFARFPFTVRDNVGFGAVADAQDDNALASAAQAAGALDVIEGLPAGWGTPLGPGSPGNTDLSNGEWQRVALARALFAVEHGAKILILDEPAAWLDAAGEADFYDRFLQITKGLTTVVVSHRFSTVRQADVIHVLDGGKVIETGDHDRLLSVEGTYAQMFQLQAARFTEPLTDLMDEAEIR